MKETMSPHREFDMVDFQSWLKEKLTHRIELTSQEIADNHLEFVGPLAEKDLLVCVESKEELSPAEIQAIDFVRKYVAEETEKVNRTAKKQVKPWPKVKTGKMEEVDGKFKVELTPDGTLCQLYYYGYG